MASSSEWTEASLGEVLELKRGYDLPKDKRTQGHVPIVSSSGVSDFHFEAMVKGPGVVTGRYGTIGEVFYVEEDYWPLNTTLYVRDFKGNDPRFISYFLKTLDFQAYSDKGAVPGVNRNHLHLAKVRVPDLGTQRRIARILSVLDNKIGINCRINQTLEAMAQAIFKSWFVDFDPVKAKIAAKAEGRDPLRAAMTAICGKPDAELDTLPPDQFAPLAATAALFPDEMEASELGEIPDGWRAASIYEIADVIYGAPFSSKRFNATGKGLPIVRIRDLKDESPAVWTDESHPKGYLLTKGDIVVGMDGEFRAYLWGGAPAWLNQRVCVFKPKSPHGAAFVRCSIAAPLAHIEATEVATTVIHLGKGDIDKFLVVVPDEAISLAFGSIADSLYAQGRSA